MQTLISVVVCTYNRAGLLKDVLRTLVEQSLDKLYYEVIVVDNNSKDDTRAIAKEFCSKNSNFLYCFEARQGLSHARNRGWQEASGQYVAYTDDDCQIPLGWLRQAKEIIETIAPTVFGGPYFAIYNTTKPKWFKDIYGSSKQGAEPRMLTRQEYLSGGNIFLCRAIFETVGGFATDLGMSGNKLALGEETNLIQRIRAVSTDYDFYYDPQLFVYHLVRVEKMSLLWQAKRSFVDGRFAFLIFQSTNPSRSGYGKLSIMLMKTLAKLIISFSIKLVFYNRKKYSYLENYLYEYAFSHITTIGNLYEQFLRRNI